MFCIGKITGWTSCVPAKIDRTNVIRLFRSVNENNENSDEKNEKQAYPFENSDEKNEKQGYPFENPDEKSEKQGRVLWSLAVLCWESENQKL